jgi:hypothetical protein
MIFDRLKRSDPGIEVLLGKLCFQPTQTLIPKGSLHYRQAMNGVNATISGGPKNPKVYTAGAPVDISVAGEKEPSPRLTLTIPLRILSRPNSRRKTY